MNNHAAHRQMYQKHDLQQKKKKEQHLRQRSPGTDGSCEGFSAGDDLQYLPGDLGLPLPVVECREGPLQLHGVVSGVAHGGHSGGELARQRLLQCPKYLAVEVQGQQRVQDLHRVLLELQDGREGRGRGAHRLPFDRELPLLGGEAEELVLGGVDADTVDVADLALGGEGEKGVDDGVGLDEGDELGVEELHLVNILADEEGEDVVGDGLRLFGGGQAADLEESVNGDVGAALKVGVALLPHADDSGGDAEGGELRPALLCLLDDIVVEASAEAAVAGDHHEGDLADGADAGEGHVHVLRLQLLVNVVEYLDKGLGEGAATDDGLLGAADLGGRHQLHGLRDLLSVLHGVDAAAELAEAAVDGGGGRRARGGRRGRGEEEAGGGKEGARGEVGVV
ncbi:unnamed protein product [Musa acuminata subsp. burmannicoides]